MVLGSGGAPEGVLAAVGLKCLGGDMQAKLNAYRRRTDKNEENGNR